MKLSNILIAAVLCLSPLSAAEMTIDQKDRTFSKQEIALHPGDTIVFKNSDEVTHNVFSVTAGMEFELRRQAPGGSSPVVFAKEGVAEVRCSIHPKMKLIVTVKR